MLLVAPFYFDVEAAFAQAAKAIAEAQQLKPAALTVADVAGLRE